MRFIYLLFFVLSFGIINQVNADSINVEVGYTIVRGPAATAGINYNWSEILPYGTDLECGISVIESSEYYGKNSSQVGTQCLAIKQFGKVKAGVGAVILTHKDSYNGSYVNASLLLGYQITERLDILWRHWSNAGASTVNNGRDVIVLSYKF